MDVDGRAVRATSTWSCCSAIKHNTQPSSTYLCSLRFNFTVFSE